MYTTTRFRQLSSKTLSCIPSLKVTAKKLFMSLLLDANN
jgi:hypothetical protein